MFPFVLMVIMKRTRKPVRCRKKTVFNLSRVGPSDFFFHLFRLLREEKYSIGGTSSEIKVTDAVYSFFFWKFSAIPGYDAEGSGGASGNDRMTMKYN